MSNPATNTSARPMLNTMDENYVAIRYRPKISERYKTCLKINGILSPLSCTFCKADEIYQSTYYQILENRVEWNFPGIGFSSCFGVKDNFSGFYFDDRFVHDVTRAHCLYPFRDVGCCPTCCDMCGEGIVVFKGGCIPCTRIFMILNYVEDGDAFVEQLVLAIKARRDGASAAPAPAQMT